MDRNRQTIDVASAGRYRADGIGIGGEISRNKVLRNTYALLSLNLAFAALVAGGSAMMGLPHPGIILTLVGYFGLLFLVSKFRESSAGVLLTFAFTGFLGYTLGPIINAYLGLPGGGQIVATALGGTAVIFGGLSAYALTTKRDFSGMGGYLTAGILTAFVLGLVAIFFSMPALSLAVSAMFMLLMAGLIIFQTQAIVNGGETNYVMATITLFVTIFNLFLSLLQLLGFANSD
ncbi:MAG: Bax inhibitor-1/YccA family protein [Burkholderiaceae bacterium]